MALAVVRSQACILIRPRQRPIQVVSFSGFRLRKFKTEARAQQYVADVQAEPQTTWFVLKNSGRDGAYSCKQTAQSFKSRGSTLVERNSLSAAKRYLGTTRVRVYRDESDSGAEQQSPAKHGHGTASAAEPHGAAVAGTSQFFAVKGGSEDGVYRTLREALGAVIKGGGEYEMFGSEAEAAVFCKPPDTAAASAIGTRVADGDMFVVWAGKSTGVMSMEDCLIATRGVAGAVAEGPMSHSVALQLFAAGRKQPTSSSGAAAKLLAAPAQKSSSAAPAVGSKPSADVSGPATAKAVMQNVEQPSKEQWAVAMASKQTRVFACWMHNGKGRIAFSWDDVARGQPADLSVQSFASESTLFLNYARAELFFDTPAPTIEDQLAAARAAIAGKQNPASKAQPAVSKAASSAAAASSATATGQSLGERVGMTGVVHTREATQIRRCFVDAKSAIEIKGAPAEPDEDELERDLPAPGSATYLAEDVEKRADDGAGLTMLDYVAYKKGKVSAWPLMGFSEFLAFCRQAQQLCAKSSKPAAVANAAVFTELVDIAVRVHMQMSRRGTLGNKEIRFKTRMYMHLQHATNTRVLFVGGPAMRAFAAAVDSFGVAKVPRFKLLREVTSRSTGSRAFGRKSEMFCEEVQAVKPLTGCFLCPATDHWANDKKFHPRGADGKRQPVSAADKKAIMARVDNADHLTSDEKTAEKQQVREYWTRHNL